MGEIVGRWLKQGSKKVYSTKFATKSGAQTAAKKAAKKRGQEAGKPFAWGSGWQVYTHKKG